MPGYILFGYPHNHFTGLARELLDAHGIQYEFRPAPEGVHPNGVNAYNLTRVPAIRQPETPDVHVADGIDELQEWIQALPD
jgi:hypothetical protein